MLMDGTSGSAAGLPGKRGSFLPRPGLSKLPTPGSTALPTPTAAGNAPPAGDTGIKSPSMRSAGFGIPRNDGPKATRPPQTQRPLSTVGGPTATRPKSTSQPGAGVAHRPTPSLSKGTANVANKASLASAQARPTCQHARQTSVASSTSSTQSRSTRQNSMQSEFAPDGHSSEESETTIGSTPTSPVANVPSLKIPKKPRPSLSDRTIETLASVPPSPAADRRQSSAFHVQGPATPQRPPRPSSVMGHSTASKINYGSVRGTGPFARPPSPSKNKPPSTYNTVAAPRRSFSTSLARPTGGPTPIARPPSPTKNGRIMTAPGKSNTVRPASRVGISNAKPLQAKMTQSRAAVKPLPQSQPQPQPQPQLESKQESGGQRETTPPAEDEGENKKPASSAALRQKIAEAKAAARNLQRKQQQREESPVTPSYDFESCEDPFNTKPKDGKDILRKRVDDARRDGRLNIAALSLSEIPEEVLSMYDADAMNDSSVAWNETVDLVRFNAADNEMVELSDKAFPDVSAADLADTDDTKGNQFGGLEHLDLHGNKLQKIPIGLRQLTRLTSLNLSRNKLDTALFDVITRIPTLCDLNLSNNELAHELPGSIGRLSLLETVDLSNNRISSLPSTLRDLSRLRTLSISHNRLQNIPFDALKGISTFRELGASHNAFSGALFPSSVTSMPKLRILDVSDNAVASLNFAKVLKLPALIRMDVSRNRLGMFPDISEWENLVTLVADENALSDLPRGMVQLKERLKTVSLDRNSIRDVDEAVADMEALENLSLAGNPLRERKLLNMETADIKAEMMRRRELASEFDGT